MGAYTLLADHTVTTNTTEVIFNFSTAITKDDFILLELTHVNDQGTSVRWQVNGNTNDNNYARQFLQTSNTSVSASRFTASSLTGGTTGFGTNYIKISENNVVNLFGSGSSGGQSPSTSHNLNFVYSCTVGLNISQINSLRIYSSSASGLFAGTRIQIYKLAAEKVADITVASNTTQVDISNLSIDKDSEYLLVSDVSNGSGTDTQVKLTVNDVTADTSYHRQRIRGDGSSASALRANDARVYDLGTGVKGLAYSHIKLSNIGAYTSQNYAMMQQGTANIFLQNHFISSTAENITSITKLNIVASATNGIGATSRFTLYKLYE